MLKTIRRVVACLVGLAFVASFLPWGGVAPWEEGFWAERAQFVPALLGTLHGKEWAWVALAGLALLTLVFGRVFCSWICPLGIAQDAVNRVARPRPLRRKGKAIACDRNHVLVRAVFGIAGFGSLAAGGVGLMTWLDPYSIAARAMAAFGNPALSACANALGADLPAPAWDRYAPWLMAVAAFSVAVPLAMAAWRGRLYCNTICPVGALLGLLARFAPCAPHIDSASCGRCAACMKSCKAHAIDLKTMSVDTSRCVACYDCVSNCSRGAMTLRPHSPFAKPAAKGKSAAGKSAAGKSAAAKGKPAPAAAPSEGRVDATRRAFLGLGFAGLAAAALPEPSVAASEDRAEVGSNASPAAVPPGAGSVEGLLSRCTGCGLCIANCPTQVLRPALLSLGARGFLKPTLDFSRGFCAYDCHRCSTACPEGALTPLALAEKQRTQIGLVGFHQERCRVWTEGAECALCVLGGNCPTGALEAREMTVPFILDEKCIGCRRCERVCPQGAITVTEVEGRERRLAIIDRSKCVGCGACVDSCTRRKAIEGRKLTAPVLVAPEKCIGCGACEHACPAEPEKAMEVTARRVHLGGGAG